MNYLRFSFLGAHPPFGAFSFRASDVPILFRSCLSGVILIDFLFLVVDKYSKHVIWDALLGLTRDAGTVKYWLFETDPQNSDTQNSFLSIARFSGSSIRIVFSKDDPFQQCTGVAILTLTRWIEIRMKQIVFIQIHQ